MNATPDDATPPVQAALTPAAYARLAPLGSAREVRPGDVVFRQGEASSDLFLVVDGEVELWFGAEAGEHVAARMGPGAVFGEMAYLDDAPRSATARAATDARLLCVSRAALVGRPELDLELTRHLARTLVDRLRAENAQRIAQHERERAARATQRQFGEFFVYVLGCAAIAMMVNHLLATRLQDVDVHDDVFSWTYLGLLLVPSAALVWRWGIPLDRFGVTLRGWRRSLSDAAVASLALGAATVALVAVVRATGIVPIHAPDTSILGKPEYLVHVYAQEFLARGLLQGSLQRFFDDGRGAVLMSSALFALLHVHFGLAAIALTFVSSVPLGVLYLRHENLLGVTLVHGVLGVLAFLSGLM